MIITEQKFCNGCTACAAICNKKAIYFIEDNFGFFYPKINQKICVKCGMCKKICPNNFQVSNNKPINIYAAWSNNNQDRENSTSGGVATVLSQNILNMDGYAVGAIYDEDFRVIHKCIDDYSEIAKLRKSKYVQSRLFTSDENNNYSFIFNDISKKLSENKKVVFVGTPCQIAGLRSFLKKSYDNLYTIDLICHGVPSQKYLNEHILSILGTVNIDELTFRDKNDYCLNIKYNNKERYSKGQTEDMFLYGFLEKVIQRDSCYNCRYSCKERVSDITLGDFWGIGKLNTRTNKEHDKGISLVLINTIKGKQLWNVVKKDMFYEERTLKEAILGNTYLNNTNENKKQIIAEKFKTQYMNYGFDESIKKIKANQEKKKIRCKLLRLKSKILKKLKLLF